MLGRVTADDAARCRRDRHRATVKRRRASVTQPRPDAWRCRATDRPSLRSGHVETDVAGSSPLSQNSLIRRAGGREVHILDSKLRRPCAPRRLGEAGSAANRRRCLSADPVIVDPETASRGIFADFQMSSASNSQVAPCRTFLKPGVVCRPHPANFPVAARLMVWTVPPS